MSGGLVSRGLMSYTGHGTNFVVYRSYESTGSEKLAIMKIQHFYSQIVNGVSSAFVFFLEAFICCS